VTRVSGLGCAVSAQIVMERFAPDWERFAPSWTVRKMCFLRTLALENGRITQRFRCNSRCCRATFYEQSTATGKHADADSDVAAGAFVCSSRLTSARAWQTHQRASV